MSDDILLRNDYFMSTCYRHKVV